MVFNTHWVNCDCYTPEHVLRFSFDDDGGAEVDDSFPSMWLEIHLNPDFSFWRRLWTGLKYTFCRRHVCTGGGWFDTWGSWNSKTLFEMRDLFQRGAELTQKMENIRKEKLAKGKDPKEVYK